MRSDVSEDKARSDLLRAVHRFIGGYIKKMVSELRLSLTYATQEFADGSVDQLLVHGEGAAMPRLAAHLSSELAVKARTLAPADVAQCPPSLSATCSLPVLSTALGLAQHPDT